MDYIRFLLFDEAGFILGGISLLLAILTFFDGMTKAKKIIALVLLLITVVIVANYTNVKYFNHLSFVEVPDVEGVQFTTAQQILRSQGLEEKVVGYENQTLLYSDNPIVYHQEPSSGHNCEKGEKVVLAFEEIEISNEEHTELAIQIIDYKIFSDGWCYEYADPERPEQLCYIDYDRGIYGEFEYSRELKQAEMKNWFHGGALYNSDGVEIGEEGNYPSFWATSDGMFAVEFPDDLEPGTYTYELYLYIDGQSVTDRIVVELR